MCEEQLVMSVYKKYHDGVLLRNMERTLKSEGFYRSEKVVNIVNLFLCSAETISKAVLLSCLFVCLGFFFEEKILFYVPSPLPPVVR